MKTESETLFESLCSLCNLQVDRLIAGEQEGVPTPDYSIRGQLNRSVVAEVKQFDPNDEELKVFERMEKGEVGVIGTTPGKRIRSVIKPAGRQLKVLSKGHLPTILVIFDNTGCKFHTDPYAVKTAMRGVDEVPVYVPADPNIPPTFGEVRPGKEKGMRADCNTSVSAIAVMYDSADGPRLTVFHNRFAAVPLSDRDLAHDRIRHFRLTADQQDWEPVTSS